MNRLWIKLIGAISLSMVLGSGAIYFSVQLFTKNQYRTMVRDGDIAAAERLSVLFAQYYAEEGSWKGIEKVLEDLYPPSLHEEMMRKMPGGKIQPDTGRGPGMARRNQERMSLLQHRFPPFSSRIVVTDPKGTIIIDTIDGARDAFETSERPSGKSAEGVPITHNGRIVGYIFVGTMIEPALNPVDREFLSTVNRAVLISTIGIVLTAIIVGSLLVLHITSPVKRLSTASSKVASGDFSVRINANRKDEIGELTRQFNKMAESLQLYDESRKQMISDSAHELRTPVSLIQGKLEMILEGIYKPDNETISEIFEETKLLSRLIEELQVLSDMDSGVLSLQKDKFAIDTLVKQAASMYKPKIEARGSLLDVDINTGSGSIVIFGDKQKLYQVLTNLLSNALRHVGTGGSISISLDIEQQRKIKLSIYNSGPQIPDAKLETIFERFYRLDPARNREHGGKGLGLSISKAIVEAHGGRIWAENAPDGGVRFIVELDLDNS